MLIKLVLVLSSANLPFYTPVNKSKIHSLIFYKSRATSMISISQIHYSLKIQGKLTEVIGITPSSF